MRLSKRVMALAMAGAMALGVSAGAVSFPDVDATTPEGEAIIKLSEMGVLGGFEDGSFRPEATVTRAQFAKIIYVLQNQGTEDILADAHKGPTKFPDVTEDQWFNGYVNWAVAEGIVGGYDDGTFKPDATLTMGQAIKMFVTANGVSADGIEYPQGFIDIAKEKGYLENVAEFTGNDNAPRGTIALVGANTLADEPAGDAVEDGEHKGIVVSVSGNQVTFADVDENGRGTIPEAEVNMPGIEGAAKNNIDFKLDEESYKTGKLSASCTVTVVDGDITSDATGSSGSVSDIIASDSSTYYSAEYTAANGEITAITYYKTGVAARLEQTNNTYFAKSLSYSVYFSPGNTSEIALGSYVSAPNGMEGSIISFTQPKYGKVALAKSGRAYRLDYTQPDAGMAVGDTTSFTYTVQNADGTQTSTGVVKLRVVNGTKVTPISFTVSPGTKYEFDEIGRAHV